MKRVLKNACIALLLTTPLLLFMHCEPKNKDQLVAGSINSSGGTLEHPAGFSLDFPEGTFDDDVDVSIELIDLPEVLPNGIELSSEVFEVNLGGHNPQKCVNLSFDLSAENVGAKEGTLGIYRWDGKEWSYTGGNIRDNRIQTGTQAFSSFVIGTGRSLHKKFRFNNMGENNAMVFIDDYTLAHPDLDAPISDDWGTPCFSLANEPIGGNLGWYPQGKYQFCADWIDTLYGDTLYDRRHRIEYGYHTLHENTSLIVPPIVYIHTSLAGSDCGPCKARTGESVVIPTEGLIAEFTFNGTPHDVSAMGYEADLHGATLTTDRHGNSNSAYYFSGSDYIAVPSMPQPGNVTMVVWFKTNHDYSSTKGFILGSASASGFFVANSSNANQLNAYLETGYNDYNQNLSGTTVNDGVWHMAAITYNGSQVTAYLDGSAYNTTDDTGLLDYDGSGLWIGRFWHSEVEFFIGSIDDIRIYDRALSSADIMNLYRE